MSLWDIAIEESKKKEAEENSSQNESTIIFLGSKGSGKTTIISRFLSKNDIAKPTIALEYTFARQNRNTALVKDVCHIWELGGGTILTKLLEIPITSESVKSLNVVLMIDLSKPKEILFALESFLTTLRATINEALSQEPDLKEKLMQNIWSKIGEDHVDKSLIEPFPVPVIILGGKYDIFQDFDPENKKLICRMLRILAHKNGAALQFCSSKIENLVNKAKILFSNLAFGNALATQSVMQDYNKALFIPFGADTLNQIDNTFDGKYSTFYVALKNTFETQFPQVTEKNVLPDDPAKDPNFREAKIDALRAQKDEELLRYQRMGTNEL